jgi:hypothetical protein
VSDFVFKDINFIFYSGNEPHPETSRVLYNTLIFKGRNNGLSEQAGSFYNWKNYFDELNFQLN